MRRGVRLAAIASTVGVALATIGTDAVSAHVLRKADAERAISRKLKKDSGFDQYQQFRYAKAVACVRSGPHEVACYGEAAYYDPVLRTGIYYSGDVVAYYGNRRSTKVQLREARGGFPIGAQAYRLSDEIKPISPDDF